MQTIPLAQLTAAIRCASTVTGPASEFAAFFAASFQREPSKPYLTSYDDATGERVELSYATFANWVWKTANYLRDGLDVQPGDEIAVLLRPHWQTIAIWYAAWTVGAVVTLPDPGGLPTGTPVAVFAQEHALAGLLAAGTPAAALIGLSLRPMAARLSAAPAGVTDYATEVPGYADFFSPMGATPRSALALPGRSAGDVLAGAEAAATELGLTGSDRVLCPVELVDADVLIGLVLAACCAGAGVVLTHAAVAQSWWRRASDERVSIAVTSKELPLDASNVPTTLRLLIRPAALVT